MTSLEEINRLLAAATPGPWEWYDDDAADDGGVQKAEYWALSPGVLIAEGTDGTPDGDEIDRANAQLIVAAVNEIGGIIERVERLQKVADAASELVRASHYEAFSSGPVVGSDYVFNLRQALEESK